MTIRYVNRILIAFVFIFALGACDEPSPGIPTSAVKVSYADIIQTPGDEWFKVTYDLYEPSQAVCGQITSKLQTSNYKFCIFSKLASACTNTQVKAAQAYKTLKKAGVPDSLIEIYSMLKISLDQPYQSDFRVSSLPSLLIIRQNKALASVIDTLERNDSTKKIPIEIFINSFMSK